MIKKEYGRDIATCNKYMHVCMIVGAIHVDVDPPRYVVGSFLAKAARHQMFFLPPLRLPPRNMLSRFQHNPKGRNGYDRKLNISWTQHESDRRPWRSVDLPVGLDQHRLVQ